MNTLERLALPFMRAMDPEKAHGLAIKSLKIGLAGGSGAITSERLVSDLAGIRLDNPIGLAAGFDKNAEAIAPLSRLGFGFLEVGAATPRAQPGNPKPRLFRLKEDQAAINRFGFNNDGMTEITDRLKAARSQVPLGLNLGANKDSTDRAADFAKVLKHAGGLVRFATVNVSSPNTEKLRDLQGPDALMELLRGVMEVRAEHAPDTKVLLKIAPDLERDELAEIVHVAAVTEVDGIVATNTTLERDGLKSKYRDEAGGLSGQPLFERSTRVLAQLSELSEGVLPLIGVGGVGSAEQAYEKIKAGACAVQLYTAMVYGGMGLISEIVHGLDALLEADGFASVSDAIGTGREAWL